MRALDHTWNGENWMTNIYKINKENRSVNGDVNNERRKNKSILREDLIYAIDTQKWKTEQLYNLIENKEKKKFLVTNVSFGVFAVLSGLVAALAAMIAKYGGDIIISSALYCSLIIVIAGANLINISVIRYIVSLKGDVLLAVRQLNCIRQSLHSMMYTLIEGKDPSDNFYNDKGNAGIDCCSVYYDYIGSHIKYPMNNEELRDRYFKIKDGVYVYDYRALYRSADLFATCCIGAFTFLLTFMPILIVLYSYYSIEGDNANFISGVVSAVLAIMVGTLFFYVARRIIRTFFGVVAMPLVPDGVE